MNCASCLRHFSHSLTQCKALTDSQKINDYVAIRVHAGSQALQVSRTTIAMSSSVEDFKPFDYELPETTSSVVNSWIVRLQAVAIVTALLAQVEASFVGSLEPANSDPTASDTALRIFAYAGLILNLGATLSAVLLLLAVTSVPSAARRLWMSCSHGYPRKVFLYENEKKRRISEGITNTPAPGVPSSSTSQDPTKPEDSPIRLSNKSLLQGDPDDEILHAFGVARGWRLLLQHCVFCFLTGCICAFVHVGILVWINESTTVASVAMPIAVIGFIPPSIIFFFGMDSLSCKECHPDK
ncbi:hypothetical protein QCA50_013329 [Cerrena zonata]|uniref:Transmembrane protein n=1 Tax=Cerrena zonata TaxID=2478898 RepID=A0AAW0FX75_9APHY